MHEQQIPDPSAAEIRKKIPGNGILCPGHVNFGHIDGAQAARNERYHS